MLGPMRLTSLASVLALVAAPASALAGGLFIPGTGTQAQARGGAFVAKADDPSALFHNPAGFAGQDGWAIHIGANLVNYNVTFTRDGAYEKPVGTNLDYQGQDYPTVEDQSKPALGLGPFQIVPLVSVAGTVKVPGLPRRLHIGFGLMAPQAYPERSFGEDYQFEADPAEPPPPTRYDVVSQSAATAMPSLALAYRVHPKVDVGGRFTWGFASLKATDYVWGVRNYEEWIASDGRFDVDVSDPFVPGFGLGVLARPTSSLELGASWSSALDVKAKGRGGSRLGSDLGLSADEPDMIEPVDDGQCAKGGTDQDHLKACVNLKLPMTATVGGRFIIRDGAGAERGDVELDVSWENWKAASDVHVFVDGRSYITGLYLNEAIIRHGFQDVWSVRLGGSWSFPVGKNKLVVRAGAAHDTKAAPLRFNRLDMDGAPRTTLAGGIAFEMAKLRIDLGGGVVLEPDRTVPSCNPSVTAPDCRDDEGVIDSSQHHWPSPTQPLSGPQNQTESPFNGGDYSSGYVLLALGVTYFL